MCCLKKYNTHPVCMCLISLLPNWKGPKLPPCLFRTLIFHYGKTPRGERTDWVIHEYRLEDKTLEQRNVPQDTYVICKLFKKNGLGPRHGSEYGAPFKDEDWSDEEDRESLVAITSAGNADPESCVSDVPQVTTTVLPPLTSAVVAQPLLTSSPLLEVRHEHDELPAVEEAPVGLEDGDLSWIQDMGDEIFIGIEDLIEPATPPAAQAGHPVTREAIVRVKTILVFGVVLKIIFTLLPLKTETKPCDSLAVMFLLWQSLCVHKGRDKTVIGETKP
ncbi:hypothetical protein Bca52824_040134 [Brassica carinata]|uniref:NAC domain-containing protein n=1 Tax=Brassica carinata TaxID=52824 RepID=A0A8X7RSG8_BRACI|nr:hypothetical protein Bca52824_040134 [Brassica carinata]